MDDDANVRFLPSLEQIAAECALIQAGWTPEERLRRTVVKPQAAVIPGEVKNGAVVSRGTAREL